jgi:CMP-N-acetylneuraminic acid synthetase
MKTQEILGVIPARGGSKRVPKKNIKLLGGKPLIAYTIESATKSRLLDDFIVSTDNQEIQDVAERFGARVIERPKVLATDWAKTINVILDILRRECADIIVCLQATSPFRTAQDIDNAINLFLHKKCDSVISVCQAGDNQAWLLKTNGEYLTPVFNNKYFKTRSQNLPKMYIPNGAIFIASRQALEHYKSFYTDRILPYVMPIERGIDVDNNNDFAYAEATLKQ